MIASTPTAWPSASAPMAKNISWSNQWSAGDTPSQKSPRPKSDIGTGSRPTTPANDDLDTLTPNFASMSFVSKNDVNAWAEPTEGGKRKKKPSKLNPIVPSEDDTAEEDSTKQNLYKTELCRSFTETGTCRYGHKCQFAHGQHELRPVVRHPKYKTETCKKFATTGHCPYGTRCRFIHPPPVAAPDVANLAAEIIDSPTKPGSDTVWASSWSSAAQHQGDDLKGEEDSHTHRLAVFQTISPGAK